MRSHEEVQEDAEKMATFKKAREFYDSMLPTLRKCNSSVSLFAFSSDQFGFAEMRNILVKTGGFSASHEQFHSNVFTDSMKNFFQLNEYGFIDKCFGARMEVSMAKGLKVQGIVGPCLSEGKKDQNIFTEVAVGEGGTSGWYLGCLDKNTSLALVMANDRQDDSTLSNRPFVMQFRTYYKNGYGQMKLRVTTICRNFAAMNKEVYAQGFDQEAAIIMTARCALSLSGSMDQKEVTKWIDKRLIKFYARFGDFTRGLPNSFKIGEEFRLVPQFFFLNLAIMCFVRLNY